ncbi:competence type IV pilus minor pilin ComGF [Sporosarcina cascadiensis]|uniref:competence type IV pilus minor pilin ComGF n=1 Tax=Sporosarcina cascadiensis TaxID=2660747 RepID=UPI00129AD978|nr:competence type IV pilus minor pilin ComGF [Sporosarcina cascadiensis]
MYRSMKRKNEKGFSLLESLIQLLIFSMLIQLTVLFFYWKAPIQSSYQSDFLGEWELFSLELQQLLKEVEYVEGPMNTSVSFKTEKGLVTIQLYNQLIRKVVSGQGHVPLLVDVASCQFTVEGNRLQVSVERLDGIKKERTFAIGLYSE